MRAIRRVSWDELREATRSLAGLVQGIANIDSLYGVPSGGAPVALLLERELRLPIVDTPGPSTLIVDDICDSGRTLRQWPTHQSAVLFVRPAAASIPTAFWEHSEDWIAFPYERPEAGDEIVTRILERIGEDPMREGLRDTPARVLRSWEELFAGYSAEPKFTTFDDPCDEMVVSQNISFISFCEHHLLPFYGRAHVAYLPNGKLAGLSKLSRLVDKYARRLQIQERMTQQIAGDLMEALQPRGVGVVVEGTHFCMMARGVRQQESIMVTSAMLGKFRDNPAARAEFLSLLGRR